MAAQTPAKSRPAEPRPLTTQTYLDASPAAVWAVVSDVRRTGEWSPECSRVIPLGTLGAGALLLGINHRRKVRWATLSRIMTYTPEHEISWLVLTNRSEWAYRLEATGEGTTLVHTRRTPRGENRFALWFTRALLGGQAGHDDELEQGMNDGLQRIKAIVERAATIEVA